jgi:hypothetical protein
MPEQLRQRLSSGNALLFSDEKRPGTCRAKVLMPNHHRLQWVAEQLPIRGKITAKMGTCSVSPVRGRPLAKR